MIGIAAYLGALILVVSAIIVTVLALRAVQLFANQRAAWRYRAKIAQLAHRVALDDATPYDVKIVVDDMANRAFDRQFFQEILSMPAPAPDREPYSVRVHREHGERYGMIIDELLVAMTYVILFSDRRLGVEHRKAHNRTVTKVNSEKIRILRESQFKPLREKVNYNFSPDVGFIFQSAE